MSQELQYQDQHGVTSDLLWVDYIACTDAPYDEFFVEAGHAIDPATQERCRSCPVRKHCAAWSYQLGSSSGYFAGLSPSQRRSMSLSEALHFIDNDRPRPRARH